MVKRQPSEWEKIISNETTDKGLISKISKWLMQFNIRKTSNPIKKCTENLNRQFFKDIDAIVPIPLHWKRMLKRHYNQSHYIAQGISQSTGIPIFNDVVKRMVNNVSQTQVKKQERKENVKDIFKTFHPEKIKGKHILLVDDVTTTGSTITSCAQELAKIEGVKISILTLAIAGRSSLPIKKENDIDPSAFGIPLIE